MHSEYANTPTAKNKKAQEHLENQRLIKSPQATRPSINGSKHKNEKAFSSFKASSEAKEHLDSFCEDHRPLEFSDKKTPVCPSEKYDNPQYKPSTEIAFHIRKFATKQHSRINIDPKSLESEPVAISSEKPSSNTVESYKSVELKVEIVEDEQLLASPGSNDEILSDTKNIVLGNNSKKSQTNKNPMAMIDKQSLILVRKQHLELKSDQKGRDKAMLLKSVVANDHKKSLIDDHGWLEKNSEVIKKQMKPVISLQSIIAPSHNQNNSELEREFKKNKFSKTFHQSQIGFKQGTNFSESERANHLFDMRVSKPQMQGAVTQRQEVKFGKGKTMKKGSQSGQLQIFKRQITLAHDTDNSEFRKSIGPKQNAPIVLQSPDMPTQIPKELQQEILNTVIELSPSAINPKVAQINLLKKIEGLQKKLINNKPNQPNKSQKTLKHHIESKTRKQSISKPESRLQGAGVQVTVAKRAGSQIREDQAKSQFKLGQEKGKHTLKQNIKITTSSNTIGQVRSELRKELQSASYSTLNMRVAQPKAVDLIASDQKKRKHQSSLVEVIKLSGKINRDYSPISIPDSIAETHKNGFQPGFSKFNQPTQKPGIDLNQSSSDDSAASILIPSENERFEVISKPNMNTPQVSQFMKQDSLTKVNSIKGQKTNLISLQTMKNTVFNDKILPGQSSQSLLEKQRSNQPLVNEVRVSDNRANKALSFVGNGLFSDQQLRAFSHVEMEKRAVISYRQNEQNSLRQKYFQGQGPGSLVATSNQIKQSAIETPRVESKPTQFQKYQPPQFLTKELRVIKSPKKKGVDPVQVVSSLFNSPFGGETTKRVQLSKNVSLLSTNKHDYSKTVLGQNGFSAAAEAITIKHLKLTSASVIRAPNIQGIQDKPQITIASKGKEIGFVPQIDINSDKILAGQKSISCLVPSKESALKSKQLLTGVSNSEKYVETDSLFRQNYPRGIRSFVVDESKNKKSFIQSKHKEPDFQPLPTSAQFTQKKSHSAKSKDSNSTDSNRKPQQKLTPSKLTKAKQPVKPNRLNVVQEERMETQDSGCDKSPDQRLATNESHLSPRTRIINRIQRQIRSHFIKTSNPPETQVEWYKIGKVMGKGAFGKVNLAIHRLSTKFVALKSINKSVMHEESSKRKVMQEFNILRHTRHCNIVRLYESFETAQHIVFVMEVCGGGDLLTYVRKRRKLKEDVAKFLFQQIITGLKYINSKNVLHRDIKLDNILLTSQGDVKICDFGVSKLVEKNEVMKEQCGTPAYIAPEVFENQGYEGYASDIWSAGVVLFAMLYGAVPFKASNMSELHKQVVKCKPTYKDEISANAKSLLQGILEKDPKKRLSAQQILEHPWMVDATKRKVSVFTEAEKKNIIEEFEYYNVRKERSFDPEDGYVMPTDPFAEQMLSSTQNYGLKNVSSRSIILAPFNSTRSHLELDNDNEIVQRLMQPKNVIRFEAKVKEIERQYEMNNNAELDNGVYNQDEKQETVKPEPTKDLKQGKSFNAEQLQSQLSELRLETEHQDLAQDDSFEGTDDQLDNCDELEPAVKDGASEWQQLKNMIINTKQESSRKLELKQSESYEEVQIELYLDAGVEVSPVKNQEKLLKSDKSAKKSSSHSIDQKTENRGTLIVEEHLLKQIERSNYPKAFIVASLNNDELNHVTTFYYLLKTTKEY